MKRQSSFHISNSQRALVIPLGLLLALVLLTSKAVALEDGLARTPPMGWNSWNKFACDVSEFQNQEALGLLLGARFGEVGYLGGVRERAAKDRMLFGIRPAQPTRRGACARAE